MAVFATQAAAAIRAARVQRDHLIDVGDIHDAARHLRSTLQGLRIAHVTLQPEPAGGINPGYRAHVKILARHDNRGSGHGHGHDH